MNVIRQAHESYVRGDPWWPRPLILALDGHRRGLAFEWVQRCVGLLLPHVETGESEALARAVDAITGDRWRGASREEVQRRAIEIWYDTPRRDAARTAVSHLYSALACPFEVGRSRHSVAMCVPIVSLLRGSVRQEKLHEMVLADFSEFAEAHGAPIDDEGP